jgi:hypothetical protein
MVVFLIVRSPKIPQIGGGERILHVAFRSVICGVTPDISGNRRAKLKVYEFRKRDELWTQCILKLPRFSSSFQFRSYKNNLNEVVSDVSTRRLQNKCYAIGVN